MASIKMNMKRRITFVLIAMFVLFVLVIGKLFIIQFVQGSDLQLKAEELRTRDLSVEAQRGAIYDRNGNKLAISVSADSVGASPQEVKKAGTAKDTASFLSTLLGIDHDTLLDKLTANKSFVWIQRKTDYEKARQIIDADLDGISIVQETQRYYPKGTLAAHILGFSGIDNQGLDGIEYFFDDELKGINGSIVGEYDAKNQQIPQGEQEYVAPQDGCDLVLTIDQNLQYFCERELDKLMASESKPKKATIIMMDPNTGAILALANRPAYDPNNYSSAESSALRDAAVSDSYEPGSTFKIITASAALEEGVTSINDRFYDPGYILVSGHKIRCWRYYNPHGSETFSEIMQNSCNPCLVQLALRLENKQEGLFYKYIKAFGFGQKTGIELPGEATGIMIGDDKVTTLNKATMAIGQSISVTPIQMVAAVSAAINGGILYKPQIVYQVKDGDQVIQDFKAQEVRRVISEDTSTIMRQVLEKVVTDGTGYKGYVEGYRVGGKTGTAQVPGPGGYQEGKYIASFIGFAPVDNPKFVMLVIAQEPQGYPYQGGVTCGPVFAAVAKDALRYMGVVSQVDQVDDTSTTQTTKKVKVPSLINLSSEAAQKALTACGLKAQVSGSGSIVVSQTPAGLATVDSGSTVSIKLGTVNSTNANGGALIVPDLTGKRIKEVADLLGAMGLKLQAVGNGGIACEQSALPGDKIYIGSTIKVTFKEEATQETIINTTGP